jgi:diaminopimelate epimerase
MPDNSNGSDGRVIMARGMFRLRRRRGGRGNNLRASGAGDAAEGSDDRRISRLRRANATPTKAQQQKRTGLAVEKWQALGNSFLLVWDQESLPPDRLAPLCDPKVGVGADGIIFATRQGDAVTVQLFNGDGSPAEYSGNGFRCLVAAAVARRRPAAGRLKLTSGKLVFEGYMDEGEAGPKRPGFGLRVARLTTDPVLILDPRALNPEVSGLPTPVLDGSPLLEELDLTRGFHVVLGNPHLIFLVDDLTKFDDSPRLQAELDRLRGHSTSFPTGINVSLAQSQGASRYLIRTWERGVGLTSACASAATALYFLLRRIGDAGKSLEVQSSGGELSLSEVGNRIAVKGPARRVFSGTVNLSAFLEP